MTIPLKVKEYISRLRARAADLAHNMPPSSPPALQAAFLVDLAAYCEYTGDTPLRLATQLGRSEAAVRSWAGTRSPSVDSLPELRARLNMAPGEVPVRQPAAHPKNAPIYSHTEAEAAEFNAALDNGGEPELTPQYFCWLLNEWCSAGIKQTHAARVLEVNISTFSAWVHGRSTPVRTIPAGTSDAMRAAMNGQALLCIERIWAELEKLGG